MWDQDRGSSDEFLGEAELDLADVLGASAQVRLPEPKLFLLDGKNPLAGRLKMLF